MPDCDLFLSYSRKDNRPAAPGGVGWVTAFHQRLLDQHKRFSGRKLKVFFDAQSIDHGADWARCLAEGLRNSRLLIAFLSQNYLDSKWCRQEWEEYLRFEHTLARGDDGIVPIFFELVPNLDGSPPAADLDRQMAAWIADIARRNRGEQFQLVPWFSRGPEVLRELDAAQRVAELRASPRDDSASPLDLAQRIETIDRHIARRLDRTTLAEHAPGNLNRSYEHFVGRGRELRQLHEALIADRIGLVGALHGLGGQGKTALAVQYAYAYAEYYAAGGRWLLGCEGRHELAELLEELLTLVGLEVPRPPATLSGQAAKDFVVQSAFQALEAWCRARAPQLRALLSREARLHGTVEDLGPIEPHLLLILDNVDRPELLDAPQLAQVAAEKWLQLIVTTRLDPDEFGAGRAALKPVPVDDLPPADALALLREFLPGKRFASPAEEAAAEQIVDLLGGFTLAVELVAAYLGAHTAAGVTCADYLARLQSQGPAVADEAALDARAGGQIRHRRERRENQVAFLIDDTLAALDAVCPQGRHVLELASLLPPDAIVLEWLRAAAAVRFPELAAEPSPGVPETWLSVLRQLLGRRLLIATDFAPLEPGQYEPRPRIVRLHRLVGEHLLKPLETPQRDACVAALIEVVFAKAGAFEDTYGHDPAILWQLGALEDTAERLLDVRPGNRELALAAGVAATAEFETGRLARAAGLFRRSHAVFEQLQRANPGSAAAARDVSVSLERLGGFYLARGQAGDAEEALRCFQQSLEIAEDLQRANPGSAAAARDVSVSLNKLGDFYLARGQAGDAEEALRCFQQSLELREQLQRANPGSAAAARDVSVSLNKLGGFYLARGQAGDAEEALRCFQQSLEIAEDLQRANPGSAAAARDVSVSLNKLGDFYLARGQAGDAEEALRCF
ncbi:MAG: toll/interleukin-1 receptor domain-containing protein, partial [Pirellulales bacterium]|nr:toll/interleukin-1 receptor domain-containing protein [Pirellulales bacterium]